MSYTKRNLALRRMKQISLKGHKCPLKILMVNWLKITLLLTKTFVVKLLAHFTVQGSACPFIKSMGNSFQNALKLLKFKFYNDTNKFFSKDMVILTGKYVKNV